jgi:hypothetical protein
MYLLLPMSLTLHAYLAASNPISLAARLTGIALNKLFKVRGDLPNTCIVVLYFILLPYVFDSAV